MSYLKFKNIISLSSPSLWTMFTQITFSIIPAVTLLYAETAKLIKEIIFSYFDSDFCQCDKMLIAFMLLSETRCLLFICLFFFFKCT